MKTERVVVNTLVFLEEIKKGVTQSELFAPIKDLGVRSIEIRREFIRSEIEFAQIKGEGERLEVDRYYSVPDELFVCGEMSVPRIQEYLQEARRLGAKMVKFNLGDFRGFTDASMKALNNELVNDSLVVTVENDQTVENGTVNKLLPFLIECADNKIPIYSTFDIGNWYWVGEDPLINAKQLAPYIQYIHLKDVLFTAVGPQAVGLGKGAVPWQRVLSLLSSQIPIALEYPCGHKPIEVVSRELAVLQQF
ncbi:MAG: sugar phosphate isomerase/epimerase [Acidibacillus sp.]|nr:sugar phosphate isomerase/epimerase [Acidibacillus sp.]